MRDIILSTPASGRILVAEDDVAIMRMVTAILENEGYTVVPALDGREAYRILRTDADFAAAIFDMNIPHIKGLEVTGHMQTERRLRRIPVMMMTGDRDLKLCSKIFAAGVAIFIHKPFSPSQMHNMLCLLVSKAGGSRNHKTNPQKDLAPMSWSAPDMHTADVQQGFGLASRLLT